MRLLFTLLECLLVLFMAMTLGQSRYHAFSAIAKEILHRYGLDIEKFRFEDLHTLSFEKITYKKRPLIKRVTLSLRYEPLLYRELAFDYVAIDGIDGNTLQNFINALPKGSSSSSWTFFIKDAHIEGYYRYKKRNSFSATLGDITQESATIKHLLVHTFAGKLEASGNFVDRKLLLHGTLWPNASYLSHFSKEIDFSKIEKLPFSLQANKEKVTLFLDAKTKGFIKKYPKIALQSHLQALYIWRSKRAKVQILAHATMPHIRIDLQGKLLYKKKLSYHMAAHIKDNFAISSIYTKAYKEADITIHGNQEFATFFIANPLWNIQGEVDKKFHFSWKSSKILMQKILKRKTPLQWLTLQAKGDPQKAHIKLDSDFLTTHIDYNPSKTTALCNFKKRWQKIDFTQLNPLHMQWRKPTLTITSPLLQGSMELQKQMGVFSLAKSSFVFKKVDDHIHYTWTIPSFPKFFHTLRKIYPLPQIPYQNEIKITGDFYPKNKSYHLTFLSPYKDFHSNMFHAINLLNFELHGDMRKIVIDYYATSFMGHALYATKPSYIIKRGKTFDLFFWIEDSVQMQGRYALGKGGLFHITGKDYHYSSIEGALDANIDLTCKIRGEKVAIDGDIDLLQGVITYQLKRPKIVEDPDIIVVDAPKKEKNSYFQKNLSLDIHIGSQKPLLYTIPDIKVWFKPDLLVWKEYEKDLQLLGLVKIVKGRYGMGDELFLLQPGDIDFYGPPTNPFLQLPIVTKKGIYTVYITLFGDLDHLNLRFESEPYLSQKDILALLLFGSRSSNLLLKAAGGEKLAGIFSNFFLKDMLSSVGIKLDKISLITSGNRIGFEIGKRISDRITVLYKNDEVSTIIVRYTINNHLESEVVFGPQRSGIDLFYRQIK